MNKNPSLTILHNMLLNADRIKPWVAEELAIQACIPVSSAYRHLKNLADAEMINRTTSGYVLNEIILEAGPKAQMALARLTTKNFKEKLYGK